MNGKVPRTPENVDILSIPPAAVEISVCKSQNLTRRVQKRVEEKIKSNKPDAVVRHLIEQEDNLRPLKFDK